MILFTNIILAILLIVGSSISDMAVKPITQKVPAAQTSGIGPVANGAVYASNVAYKPTAPQVFAPTATGQAAAAQWAAGNSGGGGGQQQQQPASTSLNNNDVNAQIDQAYNSSYDYFNQAENNLKNQLPGIIDQANQNYDLNAKTLGDQNTSNISQLQYQQDQANQSNQSQQSAIQRLYSELGQGYRQRFGGSTSAGQAASEIANVEQQRQTGQLSQKYNDTIKQIQLQQADVQQKYNTGLMQLQQQKQQAIAQAQQDFTNNLLQITQARAQTDQAKAQAKLSALMDLRNKIFTIEQQNQQFQSALQGQTAQAQQQLQNYANSVSGNLTNASNTSSSFMSNPTATSGLQVTNNQGQNQNAQLMGSINPQGYQLNKDIYKMPGLSFN